MKRQISISECPVQTTQHSEGLFKRSSGIARQIERWQRSFCVQLRLSDSEAAHYDAPYEELAEKHAREFDEILDCLIGDLDPADDFCDQSNFLQEDLWHFISVIAERNRLRGCLSE